jgi:SAM-dependent methyltransferase
MMIGRGGGGGSHRLRNKKKDSSIGIRVVDLCCGVGFSTRALRDAFPQTDTTVIGVDTSPQMVYLLLLLLLSCYIRYRHLTFTQ